MEILEETEEFVGLNLTEVRKALVLGHYRQAFAHLAQEVPGDLAKSWRPVLELASQAQSDVEGWERINRVDIMFFLAFELGNKTQAMVAVGRCLEVEVSAFVPPKVKSLFELAVRLGNIQFSGGSYELKDEEEETTAVTLQYYSVGHNAWRTPLGLAATYMRLGYSYRALESFSTQIDGQCEELISRCYRLLHQMGDEETAHERLCQVFRSLYPVELLGAYGKVALGDA